MARAGPYSQDVYGVYHEDDESTLLFSLRLNSSPAVGSHVVYTPLEGAVVTYKVERVDIDATETSIVSEDSPELLGLRCAPQVIVSTVP